MFANFTYEDKQAFFSLLDEYFESRPGLLGGSSSQQASHHHEAPPPSINSASRPAGSAGGRTMPPPAPAARTSATPPMHSPTNSMSNTYQAQPAKQEGNVGLRQTEQYLATGITKLASNPQVAGALGRVGAAAMMKKMDNKFNSPQRPSSSQAAAQAANPAPQAATHTPAGLQSSKSFGHVDVSSGMQAFKTMWRDPNKVQQPSAGVVQPPSLQAPQPVMPPPSRRAAAEAPAYTAVNKAQALYDYDGGDTTDLPVHDGQIVTIVAKTSDDWWTCADDSGKQGLVPANYLKEL